MQAFSNIWRLGVGEVGCGVGAPLSLGDWRASLFSAAAVVEAYGKWATGQKMLDLGSIKAKQEKFRWVPGGFFSAHSKTFFQDLKVIPRQNPEA